MQISSYASRISILKPWLTYRNMYTAQQLSVDHYVRDRNRLKMNMPPSAIKSIKINLQKHIFQTNVKSSIFLNEFTQFLHLIDDTDEDFLLLENALVKFKYMNMNTDNLRKVNIGSIVMKIMHHFGRDEYAQKIFSNPRLKMDFLSGRQSNLIFFDLLYKQAKYADLLKHFENLKEHLSSKQQLISRSIFVLVFATTYAQNTSESFEYAKQLHEQYSSSHITQDHLIFLSALALNQNAPDATIRYLSVLWPTSHVAIHSLRLSALLQMHRFLDLIQMLRSILVQFDNNQVEKTEVISSDVIKAADKSFIKYCEDERLCTEFRSLQNNLKTHGYIVEKRLSDMILEPFRLNQMTHGQKERIFLQAAFNQNDIQR